MYFMRTFDEPFLVVSARSILRSSVGDSFTHPLYKTYRIDCNYSKQLSMSYKLSEAVLRLFLASQFECVLM
jgi:hypothetical protein